MAREWWTTTGGLLAIVCVILFAAFPMRFGSRGVFTKEEHGFTEMSALSDNAKAVVDREFEEEEDELPASLLATKVENQRESDDGAVVGFDDDNDNNKTKASASAMQQDEPASLVSQDEMKSENQGSSDDGYAAAAAGSENDNKTKASLASSSTFPGMDDDGMYLGSCRADHDNYWTNCAARITAQLYRHWDEESRTVDPLPFSLLSIPPNDGAFDYRAYINGYELIVETTNLDGGWCPSDARWPLKCPTLASYIISCPTSDDPGGANFMTGFVFAPKSDESPSGYLTWDHRHCAEVATTASGRNVTILKEDIDFVDGRFMGYLALDDHGSATIYIPDLVSDSCWSLECGVRLKTEEERDLCIRDATTRLVELSLEEFVDRNKFVPCC